MKHKLIVVCFSLVFILGSFGLSLSGDEQGRPNAVIKDNSYEFEPVLDGTLIVHDFVVLNKGSAALEIEKVETG